MASPKSDPRHETAPFTGVGTLMMCNLMGCGRSLEKMQGTPVDEFAKSFASVIGRVVDLQIEAVNASNGVFLRFASDISFAYWHPSHVNPSHAAQAFDCGRLILEELRRVQSEQPLTPELRVTLGTDDMTLAYIGNSLQVVGRARATAERLLKLDLPRTSSVLYTPETFQLIPNAVMPKQAVARIQRSTGEEVDVYQLAIDQL